MKVCENMKFWKTKCIHINTDKMQILELPNVIFPRPRHGEANIRVWQLEKTTHYSWNLRYTWIFISHTDWFWQELTNVLVKCQFSLTEATPRPKSGNNSMLAVVYKERRQLAQIVYSIGWYFLGWHSIVVQGGTALYYFPCKVSPKHIICIKCQSLFSLKIRHNICWNISQHSKQ